MILLAYAIYTLSAVITHDNPLITAVTVNDFYDSNLKLKFSDVGFKIAFSVQGYTSETLGKDDPNYV